MKRTDIQKLTALQCNTANIRNICILAHVDHGKTTLADTLLASNGIISQRLAGKELLNAVIDSISCQCILNELGSTSTCREDEQQRGITMKSSAISLHYCSNTEEYLVNLIDSPGHIDFSSEVSTAVRLCDGAIVLVDVVEGVCSQTHAVLRQAWLEGIRPVLVLNKIDRLILELKMTTDEAYRHLRQLLEQINAVTGELFTSDVFAKTSQTNGANDVQDNKDLSEQVFDWSTGLEDTDDSNLYFCPDQGNVVFASAVDGWGYRLDHFSELYARKVGVSEQVLRKTLWGDYYVDTKARSVKKGAQAKNKKNMFVQLVLDNIWKVYDAVLVRRDKELTGKIISSLGLRVAPSNTDQRAYLQSIFTQWLPLSNAVLAMVCEQLPSPLQMSSERVEKLLGSASRAFDTLPPATQQLKNDFLACSSSDSAPTIVFISKMFPVDTKSLPKNRVRPLTAEELASKREAILQRLAEKKLAAENNSEPVEKAQAGIRPLECAADEPHVSNGSEELDHVFVAFARIFSGTLRRGQKLFVLGPKHDPAKIADYCGTTLGNFTDIETGCCHVATVDIEDLYMFMGRELETLGDIPAGNILGIGGLENCILKSGALSSTVMCPAFTDMHQEATPIVRVAIYPKSLSQMDELVRGMKLLYQSDPCVEVLIQDTGEHVIIAAGEVHLQKCLDDLRNRYAKIDIDVSAPIIPFRETVVPPPTVDRVNEAILGDANKVMENKDDASGVVDVTTPNRQSSLRIRAQPLPTSVVEILSQNDRLLKTLNKLSAAATSSEKSDILSHVGEQMINDLKSLKTKLNDAFSEPTLAKTWADVVDRIWAFSRNGTNILLNKVETYNRPSIWSAFEPSDIGGRSLIAFDSAVISGFQIATQAGPLCEEPMMGLCFIIECWDFTDPEQTKTVSPSAEGRQQDDVDTNAASSSSNGPNDLLAESIAGLKVDGSNSQRLTDASRQSLLSGQLISCVKEGCRRAFQAQPQRLMWAMYTCVIQATADVLGKVYAVLGKRNGRVLGDEMREGSSIFNVTAVLPVVESFGFAEEIRKRTSGLASPQLHFSHWEVIDVDPFWVPTTEEEYLHYGEKADTENIARKHMNAVRQRKGLYVNEKLVEFGEKQRTLKKNK